MYSNKQTINKKSATSVAKYCKVCADSKKPESVFTSHNVRDLKTNVVLCPTLLSQKCNYCGQTGHTTSHCKSKQKDARIEERETKLAKTKIQTDTAKSRKTGFDLLASDSEDENDTIVEDYPQVSPYTPLVTSSKLVGSYASALIREPLIREPLIREPLIREPLIRESLKVESRVNPFAQKHVKKIDWATCDSDSSGDEEEE
jgi:hypothetical protein